MSSSCISICLTVCNECILQWPFFSLWSFLLCKYVVFYCSENKKSFSHVYVGPTYMGWTSAFCSYTRACGIRWEDSKPFCQIIAKPGQCTDLIWFQGKESATVLASAQIKVGGSPNKFSCACSQLRFFLNKAAVWSAVIISAAPLNCSQLTSSCWWHSNRYTGCSIDTKDQLWKRACVLFFGITHFLGMWILTSVHW